MLAAHHQRITEAFARLGTASKVASELGLKPHTVRARLSEARRQSTRVESLPSPAPVSLPSEVYSGRLPAYITPVYTGHGVYEVDRALVCGDVHIPCTDWAFAERMCQLALARKIDTLFVVGDFWNMDALSRYDHVAPPAPLAVELEMGSKLMMRWRQVFKRIVVRLGNHDVRLHKAVAGGLPTELWELFLEAGSGVEFAPYGHVEIISGGQRWRATHQAAYSRIKLRVADDLANKYAANVLSFHQHHIGKTRDKWNRYTIIDGGGLFDADKFAYVNLFDNPLPVMNQGFVLLEDGWAEVLTPYPTMTKWSQWL